MLLNNDVQPRPDCLERLVAPMERDPDVGSVAALMLGPGTRGAIDSLRGERRPHARRLRPPAGPTARPGWHAAPGR